MNILPAGRDLVASLVVVAQQIGLGLEHGQVECLVVEHDRFGDVDLVVASQH